MFIDLYQLRLYSWVVRHRLVFHAVISTVLFVGCSSQSAEDREAQEALKSIEEVFGSISESTPSTVDKETVKGWPDKFCTLEINMTRVEVQEIMGSPTQSFADSNANQDSWDGYDYSMTVFYDIDDLAMQLQSNEDNVPCESVRFRD